MLVICVNLIWILSIIMPNVLLDVSIVCLRTISDVGVRSKYGCVLRRMCIRHGRGVHGFYKKNDLVTFSLIQKGNFL